MTLPGEINRSRRNQVPGCTTQDVENRVFLLIALRVDLQNPTGPGADVSPVTVLADDQVLRLGCQVGSGQCGGEGLHGQPVPGGGPELVKLPVTFAAALRAGVKREFWEKFRGCRLDLLPHKVSKEKQQS